ncbi:hypothetical protein [Tatumella sp. OPLPL6]|uniref:hypothetical protein n=1 Tax=Tatumella sp. OPLPL6 TaxID=1928657 RepID=UPI000C1846A5|nr:hypothetical protein [Tatumella sp. OPLPL6]PIJ43274.1 hypothetical protein BOM24_08875 [Tatumella sp. OPLPL6]
MQYLITPEIKIELEEKTGLTVRDLSRMMLILGDHKLIKQEEGYDVFANINDVDTTKLVVVLDQALDGEALAEENEGVLYSPLHDNALAHALMRKFKLQLTPIVTINGNLSPSWKAERMGTFMSLDQQYTGLLSPENEPLAYVHRDAITAIGICAMMAVGIGRTTFITFNEAGNASLLYMAHENVPTLYNKGLGRTIFPAPELDQYNVVGVPADILDAAIAKARTELEAAKAQEKSNDQANEKPLADAPQAQDDAPAANVQDDAPAPVIEPAPAAVQDVAPVAPVNPAPLIESVAAAPVVDSAPAAPSVESSPSVDSSSAPSDSM